jgi:hypothetical protein
MTMTMTMTMVIESKTTMTSNTLEWADHTEHQFWLNIPTSLFDAIGVLRWLNEHCCSIQTYVISATVLTVLIADRDEAMIAFLRYA